MGIFKTGLFPDNKCSYPRKRKRKKTAQKIAGPSKFSFIQLTSYNTHDHMIKMKGKEKLVENFDSAVEKC